MSNGVIYSCVGGIRFLQEAIESAKSVKKLSPSLKISLFHGYSSIELKKKDLSVFDDIKKIVIDDNLPSRFSGNMKGFLSKLSAIKNTPYDNTLFLDTDTILCKPIHSLFKLLDKFDIAIAPGPMTQRPTNDADVLSELPMEFPELNTGVILYRNNQKMKLFIREWEDTFLNNKKGLYRQHGKGGEQVSLRYLLWANEQIRMYILSTQGMPNMFNFRWGPKSKEFNFKNQIVIHHTRIRQE
tara:strand:+ start:399 stop:1121 length:723 start_codon:yes stop_codon:yes gene_type:complete